MKPYRSYNESLKQALKDPREAAAYLNTVLEEGNYPMFLVALRNVTESNGGMLGLSRKTRLSRPNLYRMLSKTGRPEIYSLRKILQAFGLTLSVSPKKRTVLKKAA